jgi:cation transport ATPase
MLAPKPNPLIFSSPLAATTAATPYATDVMEPALRAWLAAITVVVLLGVLFVFLRYWRQAYKTRIVWTMSIAITTLLALGVVAIWIVVAAMPVALNVGHPLLSQDDVGEALQATPVDKAPSAYQHAQRRRRRGTTLHRLFLLHPLRAHHADIA